MIFTNFLWCGVRPISWMGKLRSQVGCGQVSSPVSSRAWDRQMSSQLSRAQSTAPRYPSSLGLIHVDFPDTMPPLSGYHSPCEQQLSFWSITILLLLDFRMLLKLIRNSQIGNQRVPPKFSSHHREPCFPFQQVPNRSLQLSAFSGDPQALLLGVPGHRFHWSVRDSGINHQKPSVTSEGPILLNFSFYREAIWTSWQWAKYFKINTCLLIVKEGFP